MKKGDKIGIVCCSNGQPRANEKQLAHLKETLVQLGLVPVFSDYIYAKDSVFSGSGQERAESLMKFYEDDGIQAVFDISGGDIANEILPYLDFEKIAKSSKMFWGYSDLTTVINAIYAKTGKKSVLYQIRNLIYDDAKSQISNFANTVLRGTDDLFSFSYEMVSGKTAQSTLDSAYALDEMASDKTAWGALGSPYSLKLQKEMQKEKMHGIVVGGNIRCLLKLAGTEYWPDMSGKILLLEGFHGTVPQMTAYLNQLKQMGVFGRINGILLGTFTEMEEKGCRPSMVDLVKQYAGAGIPIAKTGEIGHGTNAKGIVIGEEFAAI